MKTYIVIIILVLAIFQLQAQTKENLADKPGTFQMLSRTDYSIYQSFTKAEMAANLEKIKALVDVVRQNPVLSDIKGFMGRARIYDISGTSKCGYGVPARVSFEFSDYLNNKGKISYNTIEPPEWTMLINKIAAGYWNNFNTQDCYFTIPFSKKTITPGIDVYDGVTYVIYDPNRPPYWLPVTVEEAFALASEEVKKEKDEIAAKYLNEFFDKEWADISPADRKKPAYFGGGVSRVSASPGFGGQQNLFPPIVKANPEYWNKNLPKSAIQFITFTISMDKKQLQKDYLDCLKHQYYGETCNLSRFMVSYNEDDIKKLSALIGK